MLRSNSTETQVEPLGMVNDGWYLPETGVISLLAQIVVHLVEGIMQLLRDFFVHLWQLLVVAERALLLNLHLHVQW